MEVLASSTNKVYDLTNYRFRLVFYLLILTLRPPFLSLYQSDARVQYPDQKEGLWCQ